MRPHESPDCRCLRCVVFDEGLTAYGVEFERVQQYFARAAAVLIVDPQGIRVLLEKKAKE